MGDCGGQKETFFGFWKNNVLLYLTVTNQDLIKSFSVIRMFRLSQYMLLFLEEKQKET